MSKTALLVGLLFTPCLVSGRVIAADLSTVVARAVSSDPQLAGASADLAYAKSGVTVARADILPQLTATLGMAEDRETGDSSGGTRGGTGPERVRDTQIALSQKLVDVQSIMTLRAAEFSARAQGASYVDALQDLYLRAASAYFGVLESEMEVEAYKASEEAAREVWQQAATRNKAGLVASADVQQAKVFYESSTVDRLEAEKNLKLSSEVLVQIVGEDPGDLARFPGEVRLAAPTPEGEDAWVALARSHSSGVQRFAYALESNQRLVKAARAGHLPTLNLGISHENEPSWRRRGGHSRSTDNIIAFTVAVPLFSGGATEGAIGQAIAKRDRSASDLELQSRLVESNVRAYYRASVIGVQQVERAASAVEAASSAVSSVKTGLLAGTNDMTTVLNAIDYQVQAKALYNEQLSQYFVNILSLKRFAGTLSLDDIDAVNQLLTRP